ncbi:MAG: ceramidase domain-containing protein [Myxococcota bacterium]
MPLPPVPPLPPGCPWSGWTLPNLKWCEENLCAWITAPANTWSNLAYLLLGLVMWRQARRRPGSPVALFAPASLFLGLASGVYHASYTFFFQFFDFVGMFVFCFLILGMNARRLGWIAEPRLATAIGVGVVISSAALPLLFRAGIPIQLMVVILIGIALAQETVLWRRCRERGAYRLYAVAVGLLAAGALCSALDLSRVLCDPSNHWLQGHAVWHVLTAGSLYGFFLFYRELPGA